jgi:hypothetical protein
MAAFERAFRPEKMLLVGDTGLNWKDFLAIDPDDLF